MNIQKANWNNSENRINISFPFAKVDKEKRTVSGFATLDNIDRHGDIVTAEASEKAFADFRGNLREMHAPIAVGKVLSFHPEDYFDKKSGTTYKGIYVNAYVSKGAQDTWEKVLDGTMTGFSIGGNIVQSSMEPGDDVNSDNRRVIKEYDLMELSLVDSPANPLASIFSIQKTIDGKSFVKGMAVDTQIENVFWCSNDQIASATNADTKDCVICNKRMDNIGWIENSTTEKGVAMQKVIDEYLKKDDAPGPDHSATTQDGDAGVVDSNATINLYPDQNKIKKSESENDSENAIEKGGKIMADENTNDAPVDTTEAPVEEVEKADAPVEETTEAPAEEAVEKSVTNAESVDSFAKMLTEMRDLFSEAINKNSVESAEAVQKSVDTVEAAKAEYMNAVSGMKKEIEGLTNNISDFFKRIDELEKRIAAYEGDTAVKKSLGDVDSAPKDTKLQKSFWQNSFLGASDF